MKTSTTSTFTSLFQVNKCAKNTINKLLSRPTKFNVKGFFVVIACFHQPTQNNTTTSHFEMTNSPQSRLAHNWLPH